jgi:transposase-like protein
MEDEGEVSCPYCGQACTLVLDTSVPRQRFTTDCEVCCRPFLVFAECEAGQILSLDAQGE